MYLLEMKISISTETQTLDFKLKHPMLIRDQESSPWQLLLETSDFKMHIVEHWWVLASLSTLKLPI